jgi:hypothetical protein
MPLNRAPRNSLNSRRRRELRRDQPTSVDRAARLHATRIAGGARVHVPDARAFLSREWAPLARLGLPRHRGPV